MQLNEGSPQEVLTAAAAIHVCLVVFQVDSVLFVFLQLFAKKTKRNFNDAFPPPFHAFLIGCSEV